MFSPNGSLRPCVEHLPPQCRARPLWPTRSRPSRIPCGNTDDDAQAESRPTWTAHGSAWNLQLGDTFVDLIAKAVTRVEGNRAGHEAQAIGKIK